MFPRESECRQKIIFLKDLGQNSYIWIFFNLEDLSINVYYIFSTFLVLKYIYDPLYTIWEEGSWVKNGPLSALKW